ncbi:VWA domain-containing protein [Clostridium sp.]|uniref:VWA domain-containing protein n=1 Tax=Clostridium sp. TaxID=1506 RepID=UPI00290C3973|nr:VWA domain-containing protein [Clostridium sp.]MDU5107375.1 VWA domain-containing protein [Clostridium sp.]
MKINKIKKVSLILSLIMIISLLSFNQRTLADTPDKPTFDIEMTATPDPAIVGEDITVNGVVKPNDFETEIPAKEIVLVLDTSGSMAGNKMTELKKAANAFIEKMKGVENLDIGIVQYSTLAIINPKRENGNDTYKSHDASFSDSTVPKYRPLENELLDVTDSRLTQMINGLEAKGGTNIGEGLRKAIYMLDNGKKDANKAVVLMTDGLPTFYSVEENTLIFSDMSLWTSAYTSWNNLSTADKNEITRLWNANNKASSRWGLSSTQWQDNYSRAQRTVLESAWNNWVNFRNNINNKFKPYYTIDNEIILNVRGAGSGLDNPSKEYAKYMGDLIKEKGYNAYSIGYGLDNSGKKVLKEIHQSMVSKELSEDVLENEKSGLFLTSGNAITTVFEQIATDIINSYPVNNLALNITFSEGFSLNIGGNKVDIGNITYTKVEGYISEDKVKYTAKDIPFSFIIKATKAGQQTINSEMNISYVFNNETLSHKIGEPISINIESNELPKINASLESDKKLTITKDDEFIVKYKLSPQEFEFKDINNATQKDVVLLIDNSSLVNNVAFSSLKNSMFNKLLNNTTLVNLKTNYSVITFSDKAQLLSGFTTDITNLNNNVIKNINQNSSKEANLDNAIDLVKTTLNGGRTDATKNIIIMAQDNVYYTESKIDELESKGYNIILLSLGSGENSKLIELENNKELLIEKESVFKTGSDGNDVEKTYMSKIAERLISTTKYKPYIFNPEITLNLSNNFEIVKGATTVNGNTVKIVPDKKVVYNNIGENKYHGESIEIELTVRVKDENTGVFNLGPANLKHENLVGGYKEIILATPEVTVKEAIKDLVHGLYSGLSGSDIIIEKPIEEEGFEIIGGSTLTFGAKFKTSTDKVKATLNIDSQFDLSNGTFEIYKVDKSSEKSKLLKLDQLDNKIKTNSLDININNIGTNGIETELVILYKVKVKDDSINEDFENKITIGKLIDDTKIYTPSTPIHDENNPMDKLPELF